MLWFNPTDLFKRRFDPIAEGYLYYPRKRGGGKLVSEREFADFVGDYRRWFGTRFVPGLLFWLTLAGIVFISVLSVALGESDRSLTIAVYALLAILIGGAFWVQSAPFRILRSRPDFSPPRAKRDQSKAARTQVPWIILCLMIPFPGLMSYVGILSVIAEPSLLNVAWTAAFGFIFATAVKIAIQKWMDRSNP